MARTIFIIVLFIIPVFAMAASLELVPDWGADGVPEDLNMYIYVPDNVVNNPPILVLLHYWGGGANGVFSQAIGGGIVDASEKYGFIIVVPETNDCWDYGSTQSLTRDGGGQTQGISQMVEYAISTYNANSERVYVTGDSCGGMMTQAMLAVYPDIFKAGSEFCGVPVGGAWTPINHTASEWGDIVRKINPRYSGPRPRIQLWHGTADDLVDYSNMNEAILQWTNVLGLIITPTRTTMLELNGSEWTRKIWEDEEGNVLIDAWSQKDGGHDIGSLFDARYVIPFLGLDIGGDIDIGAGGQRRRPKLNAEGTTFVTDNGQLLRGPFTSSEWGSPAPYDEIENIKSLGFNAVHIYGECFDKNYPNPGSTAPGYSSSRIDSVVQATRDLGMYLVLTIGNGANNGDYNKQYILDFWDFYSQRYANETHVLFEIQNEPVAWGPPYSASNATPPGSLDMEVAVYNLIRSHAPDTPVLLFSYAVLGGSGGASNALQDIGAFNNAVGGDLNEIWNKTAIGFHGYAGRTATAEAISNLLAAGYPCFMTEFCSGSWGVNGLGFDVHLTSDMENMQVSWTTFQYIPPWGVSDSITVPKVYKERVERAGMFWKPDFGSWPVPRGAYSDDGLPWATTETWINNNLEGTLRIEAEDFDWGGQGIAYSDKDSNNLGVEYRSNESVDICNCNDTNGGYAVSNTEAGEWLEYSIYVPEPGFYNLSLRIASNNTGCEAKIICYDSDKTGVWSIPKTGRSQIWTTITRQVFLEYGRQKMRIEILNGGFDFNWIELSPSTIAPIANGTYKFVNQNSGMVMENNTTTHKVEQGVYSGSYTQKWNILHLGAGQYRIQSANDNWYWNTWNNTMTWWWVIENNGLRFIIRPTGEGYYRITPVDSGQDYEVENASMSPGAAIVSNQFSGLANQNWGVLIPSAPAFPTQLNGEWIASNQIDLTWSASNGATSYNVKRSNTSGGPYTTIASNVTTCSFSDIDVTMGLTYYYVVNANISNVESLNSAELCVSIPTTKATGNIIGTEGSWNNDPTRTKEAAMDGDINTFYDATTGTGHWVGLDFYRNAAYVIKEVRYVPRSGYSGRMIGAKIQGSNTADFSSGVSDLFIITEQPVEGVYTVQKISDPNAYKYVRYLSAPDGFCNVAEIEFYYEGFSSN